MLAKNTKENNTVKNVAATMAVEGMALSEEFISELMKVEKGEKTSEQLRQEVIKKYSR